jgi:hypothetical protein
MKFIEGMILTPAAVSTNVREAWMLMVIYKLFPSTKHRKGKQIVSGVVVEVHVWIGGES